MSSPQIEEMILDTIARHGGNARDLARSVVIWKTAALALALLFVILACAGAWR